MARRKHQSLEPERPEARRRATRSRGLVFEELEPRLLLSTLTPVDAEAAAALAQQPLAAGAIDSWVDQPPPAPADVSDAPAAIGSESPAEIVFLDNRVPDADLLIADLRQQAEAGRNLELVEIGADVDGLSLISSTLASRKDIGAVHVISHGSDGLLLLGAREVDADVLASRAGEVSGWAASLTPDADILLYGCDVGASDQGRALVGGLARLTGADVAASDDVTGHALLGGDWELEVQVGRVEAPVAVSAALQVQWVALLPTADLQPTGDTTIKLKAPDTTNNFGASTQLIIDRETTDLQRALLQFDLSSIPANATINSATLAMQSTQIDGRLNISVYEMLQAWTEGMDDATAGVANWNQSAPATNCGGQSQHQLGRPAHLVRHRAGAGLGGWQQGQQWPDGGESGWRRKPDRDLRQP
ncbi:MAG: DUF4347 domain-containing protein [Deltaproteobacteria bacterium]|nr:MAG: DUF4347 domain-containing protein [Deltaproteobacteria bacterium]